MGLGYVAWTSIQLSRSNDQLLQEYKAISDSIFSMSDDMMVAYINDRAANTDDLIYYLGRKSARRGLQFIAGNLRRLHTLEIGSGGRVTFVGEKYSREGEAAKAFDHPDALIASEGRAVMSEFTVGDSTYVFFVGRDGEDRVHLKEPIFLAVILAWIVGSLFSIFGALRTALYVTNTLNTVREAAEDIVKGDLARRVPISGNRAQKYDEFERLSSTLNAMLDQIERLVNAMKEVTDNIAHDLRTPLNRLRGHLERAMSQEGVTSQGDLLAALEAATLEADGVLATFNALLSIARLEAGAMRDNMVLLDAGVIVQDVAELYGPLADDRGIELVVYTQSDAVIRGNRELVSQAVSNIIDNALKYSPAGTKVMVEAVAEPGQSAQRGAIDLIVTDEGPGVPEADRARVLQRFVRLDRGRGKSGSGLGLSLVSAIATLHEARLTLGEGENGKGLKVTLAFPRAP